MLSISHSTVPTGKITRSDFNGRTTTITGAENKYLGFNGSGALTEKDGAAPGGWVDYTDGNAGTSTALSANTAHWVQRSLTASTANNKLAGAFAGHAFWNNTSKLITPRAVNDILHMSIYVKVNAGAANGIVRCALLAGSLEIAGNVKPLSGAVGVDEGYRFDFTIPIRSGFLSTGAKIMITTSVAANLKEVSPEFFPTEAVS